MDVSNDLKNIRKKYNLTQVEIANILKMPLKSYQNWEQGERCPAPYIVGWIEIVVKNNSHNRKEENLMKDIDLSRVRQEITDDMSEYIVDFARKYGAWGDWYDGEETLRALDDFYGDYDFDEDEYVDVWSQLEHDENCDKFEIYVDALNIAIKSFKYVLSMNAETSDRYLDGSCPQNAWYGNDKKALVEKVYSDCNGFEYLEEDDRLTEDDLYSMIETIN